MKYKCDTCGEVRTSYVPDVEVLTLVCVDRPQSPIERLFNLEQVTCEFKLLKEDD